MNLFRKSALQKMLSPEQLDQLITITKARDWIALLGVCLILFVIILWSIFGRINIDVSGSGILVLPGGYRIVRSPFEGMIVNVVHLKNGDTISVGQVVAEISHPVLDSKIDAENKVLRQLNQDYEQAIHSHLNNIAELKQKIESAKQTILILQTEKENTTKIKSPYAGHFLAMRSDIGSYLKPGDSILSMESFGELTAIIFVPTLAVDIESLKPGMSVKIFPGLAKNVEYGYLLGTVSNVSKFPSSPEVLMNLINNDYLAKYFTQAGPPYIVTVKLIHDPQSVSGYKWSSPAGNKINITSGTLFTAMIQIASESPISLVIPNMKNAEKN